MVVKAESSMHLPSDSARVMADVSAIPSPRFGRHEATKRVRVFRNGDLFHSGLDYTLNGSRINSLEKLLNDLNRLLNDKLFFSQGVRFLLTSDGEIVKSLNDIQNGKIYVAAANGTLKQLPYGSIKSRCNVVGNEENAMKRRSLAEPKSARAHFDGDSSYKENKGPSIPSSPRRVFVLLNVGPKPRSIMRLLIDERTRRFGSLEKVLDEVTEFFRPLPAPVRKLYGLERGECSEVSDLFLDDIFIATLAPKLTAADRKLTEEENVQLLKKKAVLRSTVMNKSTCKISGSVTNRDYISPAISRRATLPPKHTGMDLSCWNINHPVDVRDRYHIGRILGNGNFATVHECVEWKTGRRVAMKIIERTKIRDKRLLGNEIAILSRLRHPNIVNMLNKYEYAGRLYVVMELMTDGDLFTLISESSKLPEPDAVQLLRCLCNALDYLHSSRVVHRDVKPENLLISQNLDGSRVMKLADFGLASEVKDGEPLFMICGSPTYVAPEILTEEGYGYKVDVWAAGVTLYIILCGFPPFQSDDNDQEALFSQILSGQFEFKSPYCDHVSHQARDLISRMLTVQVDQRCFAHEVLDHQWVKTHSPPKAVRETSAAASSSSDSGITVIKSSKLKKTVQIAVSNHNVAADTRTPPVLTRTPVSVSVVDLQTSGRMSPTFWADF